MYWRGLVHVTEQTVPNEQFINDFDEEEGRGGIFTVAEKCHTPALNENAFTLVNHLLIEILFNRLVRFTQDERFPRSCLSLWKLISLTNTLNGRVLCPSYNHVVVVNGRAVEANNKINSPSNVLHYYMLYMLTMYTDYRKKMRYFSVDL